MAGPGGTEVGRISIKVNPDTDGFRRELQRDLDAIERSMRSTVRLEAELDTSRAWAQFHGFLAAVRGHSVTINVDADTTGAMAQIAALGAASRFTGGASTGSAGLSMSSIASGVLQAGAMAAVVSLLAPALALVSGALASIPALITAVAVPLGAVALGLDGIKEAFKPLGDEFQALRDRMNGAWFAELSKHMGKLARIFEPLISEMGLPRVASAMSEAFGGIVNGLTSNKSIGNVYTILNNIAQLIAQITPGLDNLTSGFLDLAAGVTSQFPSVGAWFNTVAASFENWVAEVMTPDAHGESPMERAMQNLGTTLKTVLDLVGDLAEQGFEWLSDPEFGAAMTGFVDDLKYLINDGLPLLAGLFEGLAGLTSGIRDTLQAVNDFFGTGPGTDESALGQFSSLFGDPSQLVSQITEKLPEINAVLASIRAAVASTFQGLVASVSAGLQPVIGTVAGVVSQIQGLIMQVPALFQGAWSGITSTASGVWNGVVSAVSSALAQVVSAVVSGTGQVVAEIGTWPGRFVAALGDVSSLLVDSGVQLVQGFINGITSMIGAAMDAVSGLASSAVDTVTSVLDINSPSKVMHELGVFTGEGFANGMKAQADEIRRTMKDLVEAGVPVDSAAEDYGQMMGSVMNVPIDFAKATGEQFLADLGVSGNGFIPQLFKQGIQYIFQVGSIEEALSLKDREESKQALSIVGRNMK